MTDLHHCFDHVISFERLTATDEFAEANPHLVDANLSEVGRLAAYAFAALQVPGNRRSRLVDGAVVTPEGFKDGYGAVRDGD